MIWCVRLRHVDNFLSIESWSDNILAQCYPFDCRHESKWIEWASVNGDETNYGRIYFRKEFTKKLNWKLEKYYHQRARCSACSAHTIEVTGFGLDRPHRKNQSLDLCYFLFGWLFVLWRVAFVFWQYRQRQRWDTSSSSSSSRREMKNDIVFSAYVLRRRRHWKNWKIFHISFWGRDTGDVYRFYTIKMAGQTTANVHTLCSGNYWNSGKPVERRGQQGESERETFASYSWYSGGDGGELLLWAVRKIKSE